MAAHEKPENRLETVLEERQQIRRQTLLLVGGAITSVMHDLKTRYGLEVFQTRHLKELLDGRTDWKALEVGPGALYWAIGQLGWVRGLMKIGSPRPTRIRVWVMPKGQNPVRSLADKEPRPGSKVNIEGATQKADTGNSPFGADW